MASSPDVWWSRSGDSFVQVPAAKISAALGLSPDLWSRNSGNHEAWRIGEFDTCVSRIVGYPLDEENFET